MTTLQDRGQELWLNSWHGQNTLLLKCTDQVSGPPSLPCSALFNEMMMMVTFLSPRVKKKSHKSNIDPHFFYVLLIVHLSIFILVSNQLDTQNFVL